MVGSQLLLRGDIGCKLDDLVGFPRPVEHGIVTGLDPDFAPTLGKSLKRRSLEIAPAQFGPECLVVRTGRVGRIAEHGMVLAFYFLSRIAHDIEEILVGRDDLAVQLEFDHRLASGDGVYRCQIVPTATTKRKATHIQPPHSSRFCGQHRQGSPIQLKKAIQAG
jgi:hypothetical protein